MKSIQELAREASSIGPALVWEDNFRFFMERFHDLVIAEEHKRLLEGSDLAAGGADHALHIPRDKLYTADQMATAVLRERERYAGVPQQ